MRTAILLVVAIAVLIPSAVTVATYASVGLVWQGRYTYPVSMGVLILAGLALDRAGFGSPRTLRVAGAAVQSIGIAISELASQLHVIKIAGPTKSLIESLDWPVSSRRHDRRC